jgi:hypothetical protein
MGLKKKNYVKYIDIKDQFYSFWYVAFSFFFFFFLINTIFTKSENWQNNNNNNNVHL